MGSINLNCTGLRRHFPGLVCDPATQSIKGVLEFRCWYDTQTKKFVINSRKPKALTDSYEIEIKFNGRGLFGLPQVFETSNKIIEFAERINAPRIDLHLFPDDSCCLGILPEYTWQSPYKFIMDLVIPYFYWQTHRRVLGQEPWPGLPHGVRGFLEKLAELQKKVMKPVSSNTPCPCNRGKKYKHCHMRENEQTLQAMQKILFEIRYSYPEAFNRIAKAASSPQPARRSLVARLFRRH